MPAAWVATTYRPDDFYPGFLSNWGKTGVVLSIPTFFGLDLIGYDPAAFQEAALPLPTPGWTWDDFLRTAVQLTMRSGDQVARYGFADKYGMLASQRLSSELASQLDVPISYETMAQVLTWAETLYQRISAAPAPQISAPSTERDYARPRPTS